MALWGSLFIARGAACREGLRERLPQECSTSLAIQGASSCCSRISLVRPPRRACRVCCKVCSCGGPVVSGALQTFPAIESGQQLMPLTQY